MNTLSLLAATLAFSLMSTGLLAQAPAAQEDQKPPEHFYRLNIVLEEVNEAGKVSNARTYTTIISTSHGAPSQEIRAGDKVPVATGAENGSTQIQYLDVGVALTVRDLREENSRLGFRLVAELSTVPGGDAASRGSAALGDPVVRQNKWDSMVLIPIGKATMVDSADDLDGKGKTQVEVTATPVE